MNEFNTHQCYGCTACAMSCKYDCIEMRENEQGFQVPYVKNIENCVQCDACSRVCPVLNYKKENVKKEQWGYVAQNTCEEIRLESTSGGVFSAIGKYIIEHNGVVYGAKFDSSLRVVHEGTKTIDGLRGFRNSKYVQSYLGDTFKEVQSLLEQNIMVCFSGTPCQIEGLKSFLNKEYENLILVDVVCHGVSSPLVWRKYLENFENKKITYAFFRKKTYGYKYSTMSLFSNNEELYAEGVETDPMLRAYFSNNCNRDTCYSCIFKKRYRESDITIWDCFHPGTYNKKFDDDKGTSSILAQSQKGKKLVDSLIKEGYIFAQKVDSGVLVKGNNEMINSVRVGENRNEFLDDAACLSGKELFKNYFPSSLKIKLKRCARHTLVKVRLYKYIKDFIYIIRGMVS